MKKTLVSVIVPVYNIEKYVDKCLRSLTQQSYKELEILVVDDGSTDKSSRICDEFQAKDPRVKVFHNQNAGLSEARNFGIKKARGEYVALVDGDDYVRRDYVEKMMHSAQDLGVDIVVCGYDDEVPNEKVMLGAEATTKLLVEQENMDIVAWNKLYKRELFLKNDIWYPKGMKHEDSLTTYKLYACARKIAYTRESLYCYVVRGDSIMGQAKTLDRLEMRLRAANEAVEYLCKNKELRRAAEVAVLTARFAFVDAALKHQIPKEQFELNRKWILQHKTKYAGNDFLHKKVKMYLKLLETPDGIMYKLFRKVKP